MDLQYTLLGVADETPVTTALTGTGDTTPASYVTTTKPTLDTANLVNGYPMVRFNQVANLNTFLLVPATSGTTRTFGFVFRYSAVASVSWVLAGVDNAGASQCRLAVGGTAYPGSVRLWDLGGAEICRSSNNVMAAGTSYYLELQHTSGALGLIRLRVWDMAQTLLYDSTPMTANLGASITGFNFGQLVTAPTVPAFWVGLLVSDPTITTFDRPLGGSAPTTPRVRGVVAAGGSEVPAVLRGVIAAGGAEVPATLRNVT